MKTKVSSIFLRRVLQGLMVSLVLGASTPRVHTEDVVKVDAAQAYEHLWNEAAAAVLAIAATPDVTKEPIDKFKAAQVRLERAVVRLIGLQPPTARLTDHLFLLPVVQEVAAAARAVVDDREAKDEPGIASDCTWLDESLARLAAGTRQARQSTAQR